MGGIFSAPKQAAPPPPPPPPQRSDQEVQDAALAERRRRAAAVGRASTIKTGGQGVTDGVSATKQLLGE